MSSPCTTIKEMDAAIERYFISMGRSDYQNQQGIGKFAEYCLESSVDDDEIENDDNYDAEQIEESIFTYFLEEESLNMMQDFPWIDDTVDSTQKKQHFLALVQKIRRDKNVRFSNSQNTAAVIQVTASHFKEARASVEHVRQTHTQFVPLIFSAPDISGDQAFFKLLAMSHVLRVPYLQYLADLYARDRLRVRVQHHRELSPVQWVKFNPHCAQLTADGHHDLVLEVQHAITSFYHRVVPKLTFRPSAYVQDSLEQTVDYIVGAIEFVHNLCSAYNHTCPFQYDAVIAYLKSADASAMVNAAGIDEEEDSGGDAADDDEKNENEISMAKHDLGDVEGHLKQAQCLYRKGAIETQYTLQAYETIDDMKQAQSSVPTGRALRQQFDAFVNLPAMSKKYGALEEARFPRQHRFISMIDRRTRSSSQLQKMDDLYFYEPPSDCLAIPKQPHLDLWYFDASKQCILPREDASGGNITSSTSCGGKILLLSFHVVSTTEIRAYLYLDGGVVRFFADDIVNVLPLYFEKSKRNKQFMKSKTCKAMMERVRVKLKDARFEAFLEKNRIENINDVKNWTK